jgi:5-methylcytosine-specific restriction enzyme A
MDDFYVAASPEHQKREKAKARELRQSQWWKNQKGKGLCYYCQQQFHPSLLTMDHVIPIARGGKSSKKNCVPCCKQCNTKKAAKTTVEMAFSEEE